MSAPYWLSKGYALRLASGRLQMLLGASLPDSDHPGATQHVLDVVNAALVGEAPALERVERLRSMHGQVLSLAEAVNAISAEWSASDEYMERATIEGAAFLLLDVAGQLALAGKGTPPHP